MKREEKNDPSRQGQPPLPTFASSAVTPLPLPLLAPLLVLAPFPFRAAMERVGLEMPASRFTTVQGRRGQQG